jgi:hypothetical protein
MGLSKHALSSFKNYVAARPASPAHTLAADPAFPENPSSLREILAYLHSRAVPQETLSAAKALWVRYQLLLRHHRPKNSARGKTMT